MQKYIGVVFANRQTVLMGSRFYVGVSCRSEKSRPPKSNRYGKRDTAYTKQEQFWAALNQNENWRAVVSKFDRDKSGDLSAEELTKMIKEFGRGTWAEDGTYHPPNPKGKEIAWILHTLKHESIPMDSSKLKFAIDIWHAYENIHLDLNKCFKKFDLDKSGDLDRGELSRLLKELNEGHSPTVLPSQTLKILTKSFKP